MNNIIITDTMVCINSTCKQEFPSRKSKKVYGSSGKWIGFRCPYCKLATAYSKKIPDTN